MKFTSLKLSETCRSRSMFPAASGPLPSNSARVLHPTERFSSSLIRRLPLIEDNYWNWLLRCLGFHKTLQTVWRAGPESSSLNSGLTHKNHSLKRLAESGDDCSHENQLCTNTLRCAAFRGRTHNTWTACSLKESFKNEVKKALKSAQMWTRWGNLLLSAFSAHSRNLAVNVFCLLTVEEVKQHSSAPLLACLRLLCANKNNHPVHLHFTLRV